MYTISDSRMMRIVPSHCHLAEDGVRDAAAKHTEHCGVQMKRRLFNRDGRENNECSKVF
jgi:hypothetical protein